MLLAQPGINDGHGPVTAGLGWYGIDKVLHVLRLSAPVLMVIVLEVALSTTGCELVILCYDQVRGQFNVVIAAKPVLKLAILGL